LAEILFRQPFAWRKKDDGRYTFVGEYYVHGRMKGEAIEKWRNWKLKDQFFDIV
jgi:hypothetical protein